MGPAGRSFKGGPPSALQPAGRRAAEAADLEEGGISFLEKVGGFLECVWICWDKHFVGPFYKLEGCISICLIVCLCLLKESVSDSCVRESAQQKRHSPLA